MIKRIIATFLPVIVALIAGVLPSTTADDLQNKGPILIASGPDFAIHQFEGFINNDMVESVIRPGIVISHIDLKSGEMKWLVATGVHSISTRRISYAVTRLVGLTKHKHYLIVVLFSSGRVFTPDNRPPEPPDPRHGQYDLRVFSVQDGKEIYTWTFADSSSFPSSVPEETTGAGVIKKKGKGYQVFDCVFGFDAGGKVIKKKDDYQRDAPAEADEPLR
jgi:hypothetical protein